MSRSMYDTNRTPPYQAVTTIAPPVLTLDEPKVQKRCGSACCKVKLMLTDLTCNKCKTRFCRSHRLPELHACPHDFQKEGQAILAERNPVVTAAKIERI